MTIQSLIYGVHLKTPNRKERRERQPSTDFITLEINQWEFWSWTQSTK